MLSSDSLSITDHDYGVFLFQGHDPSNYDELNLPRVEIFLPISLGNRAVIHSFCLRRSSEEDCLFEMNKVYGQCLVLLCTIGR
jgi:hypothetical protein